MKRIVVLAAALLGCVALYAQQPGLTRKLLQDQNLSVNDRHAVQALAEFVPGGAAGKHTHPGEELGYVIEGISGEDGAPDYRVRPPPGRKAKLMVGRKTLWKPMRVVGPAVNTESVAAGLKCDCG